MRGLLSSPNGYLPSVRRDVLRVGLGRIAFELALGVVLLLAASDLERDLSAALALLGAATVFLVRSRSTSPRTAFVAAHVALGGAALLAAVSPWAPNLVVPGLALALGIAIELTHGDLMTRRRIHETVRTIRWPRSVLARRMGSVLVATAGARGMHDVEAHFELASPLAVVLLLSALGACAALTAGFRAGPGRPRTRPIDAFLFLGFALVLALCPLPRAPSSQASQRVSAGPSTRGLLRSASRSRAPVSSMIARSSRSMRSRTCSTAAGPPER